MSQRIARAASAALLLAASPLAAQQDSLPASTRAAAWATRGAIGASLVGLAFGTLFGSVMCDGIECRDDAFAGGAAGLIGGAVVGGVTGWVLGSFVVQDRATQPPPQQHWDVLVGAAGLRALGTGGFTVNAAVGRRTAVRTEALVEAGYGRFGRARSSVRVHDGMGDTIIARSSSDRNFLYLTLVSRTDIGNRRAVMPFAQARVGLYNGGSRHEQTHRYEDGRVPDYWQDISSRGRQSGVGGGLGAGVRAPRWTLALEWLAVAGAQLDVGGLWTVQGTVRL